MENNDDCSSDEISGKHSPFQQTYAYGLYGELVNVSRIGDEYQTEIPSLITNSEYLDYIKNPMQEEKVKAGVPNYKFLIGLDIPVFWINQKNTNDNVDEFLVPGCILKAWSEMERRSFVLGLYIFEKDFVSVQRFMGSKNIGEILSYYYGDFYRNDEYKRWSDCRKSRGKKCVLGQRIFSGLRQQEFLARLVPRVSQECQNSLLEVSRTFEDGGISLRHYVISLKTLIGLEMFVDAIAIGKGKQDLTGSAIEPTKENQSIHIRPEIPIGKACSALTTSEIVMFLTGDYRLSKARSNDLFWEAVWPRLLARGWHSEQPSGYNFAANGMRSLVFLMPGVKKFSRRLVKGEAYLDSVTDVLNKVALDPQLIELDCDENGKTEVKLENEEEEQEHRFPEKWKSYCYLQPRAPNTSLGNVLMKFTVVDTSLGGGKVVSVREFGPGKWNSRCRSDETHSELVSSDESDQETRVVKKQKVLDERKKPEKKNDGSDECPTRKVMKENLSRKSKQKISGHNAKKRRKLTACCRVDSKGGSSLERDMGSSSHVGSSSQANNVNHNHKLSSNLSFTSRCSSIDTVEEQGVDLIDLNVTPECGNGEFVRQVKENIVSPKEQENGGSRRQSTRNRPPTARALEAFANGFLTVNSRKKSKEDYYYNKGDYDYDYGLKPKKSRGCEVSESSTGDASSVVKGEDEDGVIEK